VFRDVDLVCLAVVRRGDALQLRPGFRRHGTGALARASAVIVVAEGLPVLEPEAVDALRRALGFGGLTAAARKVTGSMWSYPDGATVEPGALRGRRAATVCAIGDPGSFSRLASDELALEVVARRDATDHHRFEAGELDAVETYAGDHGATMVLTTGKDAVRLPPAWSPRLTWVVLEPRLCWDVGYAQLSRELEAL
jgi:tetraacyldisaccharide 4'-kinase